MGKWVACQQYHQTIYCLLTPPFQPRPAPNFSIICMFFCICCNKLHSLLNPIPRPNDDPVAACKQTRAYTGIGLKGRNVLVLDFVIKMVNSCYYKCDFLPSKNCWLSIMTEQHFLRKVWSGPSTQAQGHTLGCWWNHWLIPLHTGSRCPQCVGNWTFCPTCLAHKGAPV